MSSWMDLNSLKFTAEQWPALLPYLWLCLGIAVTTVNSGFNTRGSRFWIAATLIPYISWLLWDFRQVPQSLFGTALEVNTASRAVGAAVGIFALLSSLLNDKRRSERGECAPLLLIAVLGMSWLPCARNWTAFFVYMETFAIASYVLVSLEPGRESSLEAGMKYLLLGAFSSAILLMGTAFLFGAFGQLDFEVMKQSLASLPADRLAYVETGAGLVVIGLCFKAALAPFHMWAPDVYQGAPLPAAAFLAAATKLCVLVATAVALEKSGLREIGSITQLLLLVGAISVVVGSAAALAQKSLRRVIAYSGIVNAGYGAFALAAGPDAMGSMSIMLALYGLASLGLFASVASWTSSPAKGAEADISLNDLGTVASESAPWVALLFSISVFSAAGLPPLPGFFGKYILIRDLWSMGSVAGAWWVVGGTLMGLGYYLRLLVPLYLSTPTRPAVRAVKEKAPGTPYWGTVLAGAFTAAALLGCLAGFSRLQQWVELVEGGVR